MDRIGTTESRPDRVTAGHPPFEDFYRAELPRLVALARGLCAPTLGEDVAQEAMLVAYRRWGMVSELERPDLWVRRVCANLAVSSFRRRIVELRGLARIGARREPAPMDDLTADFWSAVRALPQRQAQAAALRFVYDLPIADIARVLGISEGAVKQHLSRARHTLREVLHLADEGETS